MQRILLITGIAAAGLAGSSLGDPAQLAATLPVVGFVSVSGQLVLLLASVAATLLGALDLGRGGRRVRLQSALLPALLTLGLFLAGPVFPVESPHWLPVAVLAVALPVVLFVESGAVDGGWGAWLITALRPLLVYLTALVLFAGVYGTRWRALLACPAIGVGGALLALALWRHGSHSAPRSPSAHLPPRIVSALVVGLALAQAAWALLFWPAPALIGGLALLAVFYAASGVMAAAERGTVRRALAAEYAVVGVAALAVIVWVVLVVR